MGMTTTRPPVVVALLAALLALLTGCTASGPTSDKHIVAQPMQIIDRHLTISGHTYAWSIMIPPGAAPGGPAILFLHGYGECGTDGRKQLSVGLPPAVVKDPQRWPFVLIVPQKPVFNSEWEAHEPAVMEMIAQAAREGSIDPKRLAITGLSQGGHGTIAYASRHPELFTAAAPVCGYTLPHFDDNQTRIEKHEISPTDPAVVQAAEKLSSLPVWLFHGSIDSVVPVAESRSLYQALKKLDADVKYTEVEGANHNSWDAAYADPDLARWFLKHKK